MIITREKGMRMWGGGSGSTSASGVNGGGGFSLAVTEGEGTGNAYTGFTYESGVLSLIKGTQFVTTDFFNRLFTAYDANGTAIVPNDTTTAINNLKIMVGTWTEQYLSALGQNSSGGGGGGAGLEDVWDSLTNQQGTVITDNTKIAIAHIPDTSSTYGYLKSSALNGYATQTWVNQQGFLTTHQTLYTLSIYGGTTKVLDFKPNANASIYIKAGGDISLTNDTTNKYITLSYTHPTNGANTTISAASGKVLSAITVNSLGHVTSVSSKTLASADIPDISATYATASRATTLEGYFNSGGVAKVAAKLNTGTTTYTAWGQTYWSSGVPQSISGNMTSVGSITPSANGNALGTTSARFNIYGTSGNFSGNVSITGTLGVTGATTLSSTLSVAGGITLTTTKRIYFGDTSHYLELDSTGFHFSHGVYSDSFVSALGANSSGGGSGTFDEEAMWTALGTTSSAKVIASSHIPNLSWAKITSGKPTTLSGYGISDAYTKTQVDNALDGYLVRKTYGLDGKTAVRITFNNVNGGIINVRSTLSGASLILVGNGYGEGGTTRNNWVQLSSTTSYFSWCIPTASGIEKSVEIYNSSSNSASVVVAAFDTGVTFTELSALSTTASTIKVAYASSLDDYLPLSGGTLQKSSGDIPLYIKSSNTSGAYIGYQLSNGTTMGFIGVHATYGASYVNSGTVYPILRSDNYSSYALPLSGGTITGNLISTKSDTAEAYFRATNSNGSIELLTSANRGVYDRTTTTWLIGTDGTNTWLSQGNVGIGTTTPGYKLGVVGTVGIASGHLYLTGAVAASSTANTTQIIFTASGAQQVAISSNSSALIINPTSSTTNNQIVLGVGSVASTFGNSITCSGEVTASSDGRKKNIISNTKFNVKDIASARSVLFEWNDGRDDDMEKKIHGGSIAQDWLGKADSFLSQDNDGWYSINYGALALCSAITIAREVVKHDDEITRLKKEVVKLRERVAELEERRIA